MSTNYTTIKNFYTIAEFYKFIQNPDNAPSPNLIAVAVPFIENGGGIGTSLFSNHNLYRFALSIQKIQKIPNVLLSTNVFSSPFTNWNGINNDFFKPGNSNINIQFLEMADPIIENFVYPWFLAVNNVNTNYNGTFDFGIPMMNLAIKIYHPIKIAAAAKSGSSLMPSMIYYLYGLWPTSIELAKMDHYAGRVDDGLIRNVQFNLNQVLVFPNIECAKQWHLGHLFTPIPPSEYMNSK